MREGAPEPESKQPGASPAPLREEQRGRARWLVLDRPARRNALSRELLEALRGALARADADPAVRAIALTGAGDKAFCAGADLSSAGQALAEGALSAHEERRSYARLLLDLARLGKPVVACVNGAALGGGLGLVAACDFALAADGAWFGTPEVDVGLFPFMALAPLLRCVGRRSALDLAFTGRRVSAPEALQLGLLNDVLPAAQLEGAVQALLERLAGKSPTALRLGRRALYATQDLPYEAQLEALASQLSVASLSEDAAEGVGAFLEKRPARFPGR